ncbi:MAG: hypothetical protein EpisKO_41450 [Epibacterium sp.]
MRHAPISSIYGRANGPAPVGSEAKQRNKAAMAEVWHKHGVLVVDPNEISDDWSRQHLTNVGETLYGKRKGGS